MRSWKDIRKKAEEVKKGEVNLDKLFGSQDLSLQMIMSIMENPSVLESKAKRRAKFIDFYKSYGFWGTCGSRIKTRDADGNSVDFTEKDDKVFSDFVDKIPETHELIVPFPALAVPFEIMTERIFKERTKLLVKTTMKALENHEYSTLNWWYFVKMMYPEIDNQLLVQYRPKGTFSYANDSSDRTITITNIEDLYQLSQRTGVALECYELFDKQDNPELSNEALEEITKMLVRSGFWNYWSKTIDLFKPFGVRKRLRILSTLSYPFNSNDEDMLHMFMRLDTKYWQQDFTSTDKRIRKNLEDCVNTTQLHDAVFYRVRFISTPFEKAPQDKILFLEAMDFGEYKVRVPKSNHDLDYISARLHNCVGKAGYFEKIKMGKTFIIEILKDGRSHACLEYSRSSRRFIQAKILKNQEFTDRRFLETLEKTIKDRLYPSLWKRLKSFFKNKFNQE